VIDVIEGVVGAPVALDVLKHKPGRRRTLRARGPRRTAIVKRYVSGRAPLVAQRVAALAAGPPEPVVPAVLRVDPERRFVVLSDVPGPPLRKALLGGELETCARAGAALGTWHAAWSGVEPTPLEAHTVDREVEILRARARAASSSVAGVVADALPSVEGEWACGTVVHRDLYEEQILAGERVGLIDLDDAALGPPELDVGNFIAHAELLERRRASDLTAGKRAFLDGYADAGPALDEALLDRCRRLSLLRLACLNHDVELATQASVKELLV
jgi:aminoglycoside phosphotransferase (APT) family kinase protein